MGCWNETCALTRLPIRYGAPVVALTTVYGPDFRGISGSTSKNDLLFGLPLIGTYDDYGGVESLKTPELDALHEKAFEAAGYFKKFATKTSYGSMDVQWLAAHEDTLWSLSHRIKPLFFAELGVTMAEAESHDEAARAKTSEAFKRADEALKQLGAQLGATTFSEEKEKAYSELFAIFENVFGKGCAWPAYHAIIDHGLFASRGQILMHQSAYQAVVSEFGQRKVGYYTSQSRSKMRDFLSEQLDEWAAGFADEYKKLEQLWGDPEDSSLSEQERRKKTFRFANNRRYSIMNPLTSMWMSPELPLIGHFWGGAMPEEILAVVPKDDIVDYLVFQWARHYLRIDLQKPGSGSQNEEVVLPNKVFKATMKALREDKFVKTDFDGTLYR